jgi:hypothetical protein
MNINKLGYVKGIYFNKDIIDKILSGKKTIYSRTTCFKELLDDKLLLVDGDNSYGMITFQRPKKCLSSELMKHSEYSKIIHNTPNIDIPLLLHKFTFDKFEKPVRVLYKNKHMFNEYIPEVCIVKNKIQNIYTHDVSTVSDDELINNHDVVHMLYDIKESGNKSKYMLDDLNNLHKVILTELNKRKLYHESLSTIDDIKVKKSKQLLELFDTCRPHAYINTTLDNLLSTMQKSSSNMYIVEPTYDSSRCLIHKKGKEVKIYSGSCVDITSCVGSVINSIVSSSNQDYILEASMVYYDKKDTYTALSLHKKITDGSEFNIKDVKVKLFVYDVLYYNKDITQDNWGVRHRYLNKITFSDNFKLVPSHLIVTSNDLKKYTMFVSNLNHSQGAIVKSYNSRVNNPLSADYVILSS